MEIFLGIFMGITWVLVVAILRSLTTLFHEFGHAIPSLAFTKSPVKVFIGTYGNSNDGLNFNLGRLQVFFKFNIFNWNMGLCSHSGVSGFWRNFWIIIGGPIASMLIALPLIYFISNYDLPLFRMYAMMAFLIAAFIDFFVNIIPQNSPIATSSGRATYNDGYQLFLLFKRATYPKEYFQMEKYFYENKFDQLFEIGKSLFAQKKHDRPIYDLMINASMHEQEYEDALYLYSELGQRHKIKTADHFTIGIIHQNLEQHKKAIQYFNQYIHYHYQNPTAHRARAQSKIELEAYQGALTDLNLVFNLHPQDVQALILKGYAHKKLTETKASEKSYALARRINPEHPFFDKYA